VAKKKEGTITKTKEFTGSGSQTRTGEAIPNIEQILGKKDSPPVDDDRFLLKLKSSQRLEKILNLLNVETAITSHDRLAIVIGPFSRSQVIALCEAKLLTRRDELLVPQGNWKGVSEIIEEVKLDQLVSDEITHTQSVTESITETAPMLEEKMAPKEGPRIHVSENTGPSEQRNRAADKPTTRPPPKPISTMKISTPPDPASKSLWAWLAVLGVVVGGIAVWKFGPFGKINPEGPSTEYTHKNVQDWPDNMRELDFNELKSGQAPLIAKLDPILEAYERGAKVVSEPDQKTLKVLAGPGSASLEARVVATNVLAALALSRAQTDEAKKLLDRLLEIVPTDSTTLLNRALTYLVSREYREAKEISSQALRLCKEQSCWVARAILGLIAAEESRWSEAEENFKAAMEASRGNMWVTGLWLRSLKGAPKEMARSKSTLLLTESLVLDPDLMIDSPLRAPLATQVFLGEVLRGFRNAMTFVPDALTEGQKKYLEWLLSRFELNPLSTSAQEALDMLKSEAAALSQLSAAYLEKENNHLDIAAEILSRTLTRLSSTQIRSSWPWAFAGDIQRNRGLNDQAVVFYESALSRNPRDVNAVFGLALILRDKKDYKSSAQKMEEVISLDPNFVPVQLRRDRFEWERHWLAK
jgi:tetratricopeptide (TPR) repeat protein